ncbi:hypothetical protein SKAU_G00261240 [Synaphobranchus kaupii]|uniref:Uncharacterized protein n=1 Tax=Synaphobranchus kaupii TaxID=118154 RepID=A0A9Q1INP4_SYNKA|nr:hypothetical protein SKAU_G00261240 [Synaphobranchus kaupii]
MRHQSRERITPEASALTKKCIAMGNNFTKAVDKWGLNPRKFTSKSRKGKEDPVYPPHQPSQAHVYDTVADIPVYSVVNKKKKQQEELHYAEVQVLQSHSASSRGGQRPSPASGSTTEYATINFQTQPPPPSITTQSSSLKASISSKPADILIPPGNLQRPITKACTRKGSSKKAVVV